MIAAWLTSVLESAGCRTALAADLAGARRLLRDGHFDAWLCDLHLPDGLATELLDLPGRPPAIALTAELDAAARQRLARAGFAAVLGKPCPPDALLATLSGLLGTAPAAPGAPAPTAPAAPLAAVLDDDMALRSCGDAATVRALRELLVAETAALRGRLAAPWDEAARGRIGDELHRLAAAARWCGAAALAAHLAWLRPALADAREPDRLRPGLLDQLDRLHAALQAGLAHDRD